MKPNPFPPLIYSLRRSQRAKAARIVVKPGRIEVVAPLKVSERRIKEFVESQQDWIRAAVLRVTEKAHAIPSFAPAHYTDGVTIPYQGKQVPLSIKPVNTKTIRIHRQSDLGFTVSLPNSLDHQLSSELIRLALIRWMKNQIRQQAGLLIDQHAGQFALFPRSLKIKAQKSRWGSCGPNNDINLNWLLILAPPEVLEYVVVHELCHIRHKNHSKDFWGLVLKHLPDYVEPRRWLKQHGASLMKGL